MRNPLIVFFLLATLSTAWARVGGGESYSGGGSSSSSSGGGGDGQFIGLILELIIRLIFYYPMIGIPLLIGVAIMWFYFQKSSQNSEAFRNLQDWSAKNSVVRSARPDLSRLRAKDRNFSETLFLDFLTLLYTKALQRRGESLADVGAYVTGDLRRQLELDQDQKTDMVIIGGVRLLAVNTSTSVEAVDVQVEANVALSSGAELFVVDVLSFQRNAGVQTRSPEVVYAMSCPGCGNNTDINSQGACPACGNVVNDGRWSWVLQSLRRQSSTTKPPVVVSDSGAEIGTDLPTVRSRELASELTQLRQRDPQFDDFKFKEYARSTFLRLQAAWTERDWSKARPLETDYLFQQHQYWIHAYQNQGVRNVLEEVEVTRIELAKVSLDRYFDAITVRIFAQMKDYTVDAGSGQILSGSPSKLRRFSEYWTFVRRFGVTSVERDATRCPNCGGPLDKVTQVGDCEYCHTRITRGDFDWILSRIEQDEAYF